LDSAHQAVTFIKTGGVLEPDTYAVTLRSAADGFKALDGILLDGNGDNVPGDNFSGSFDVAPSAAVVVSIADFARGPGQIVAVPAATGVGIPLNISDGTGVQTIDLNISYDPALLTISAAAVAA